MPADNRRASKTDYVTFLKKCRKQIYGFFNNTSIHGVKYLAEVRRPHIERILWLVGIILSLIACGYLIYQSWERRASSPVILAMDKKQRAVWEIPFPAVTICPTEKIRPMVGLTAEEQKDVACAMNLVCESKNELYVCQNFTSIIKTLTTSAPQPDELFVSNEGSPMIFLGSSANHAVRPLLANGGLCYSFNMFPGSSIFANNTFHKSGKYLDYNESVDWDIENGYKNNVYPTSYPRRALGAGGEAGLLMLLKNEGGFNSSQPCNFIHGFELQVHNPVDFPSGDRKYYAPLNSMMQMFVTPEEVLTDDLRSYLPEQRQCYYPDEHKLEFFQVYSQKNCELECLSKVTLECCACVAFYMPRFKDTPVCLTESEKSCMVGARERMYVNASGVTYTGHPLPCAKTEVKCKCLPSCAQLHYRYQVAHTKMDRRELENILSKSYALKDVEDSDFAIIHIFYTESHFIPFRRLELYGTVEFLANCGGVLGLCLGVSVLSIVELLYWLLVRAFCQARPDREARKPPETTHLTPL